MFFTHAKRSSGWWFEGEKGGRSQGFFPPEEIFSRSLEDPASEMVFTLYTGIILKMLRKQLTCWIFLWQVLTVWRTTVGEPTLRQEMWIQQWQIFLFLLVDMWPLRIGLGEASRNSVLLPITFQTWWWKPWNRTVQDTQNGISTTAVSLQACTKWSRFNVSSSKGRW